MLADGFDTAGVLSLVIPLALLPIVFFAWWIAVRRGGLGQSATQDPEGGSSGESPGA
jgi:hypothetical protein